MTEPVISILIPTYNRERYLRCLLADLVENISALKHAYEIVISDNASTDATEAAVHEFIGKMNIRYLKRDKNYGALDNWLHLKWQAKGVFQVYLADDDGLIVPELSNIIDKMIEDPEIGIVYGPWLEFDRVSGEAARFYKLEQDVLIEKNQHVKMLDLILDEHIFPEMFVVRSELVRIVSPFENAHAYWAFVHAAEYLSYTKVLYTSKPYYLSINRYFKDEYVARERIGCIEVQDAWDRYRGGLEYILSRAQVEALGENALTILSVKIQRFVAMRLAVGILLRMKSDRNPIDTYYLACRLKAMGFLGVIYKHFEKIRYEAIVHHVLHDSIINQNVDKIMFIGAINDGFLDMLLEKSHLPVYRDWHFRPELYENAIVLLEGGALNFAVDKGLIESRALHLVGFADLLQKFS